MYRFCAVLYRTEYFFFLVLLNCVRAFVFYFDAFQCFYQFPYFSVIRFHQLWPRPLLVVVLLLLLFVLFLCKFSIKECICSAYSVFNSHHNKY